MIERKEAWTLTVHWFPRAAEAGVRPCEADYGELLRDKDDQNPALYRPHEFTFSKPPSREDCLAVVRSLPWAQWAWEKNLLPLIQDRELNQWPIIDSWHKAASVDVLDYQGRKVGRIEVDRLDVYANAAYVTLPVEGCVVKELINRRVRPFSRRPEAHEYVRENENRIRERIIELLVEGEWPEPVYLATAIEEVLIRGGFTKPVKVPKAKVSA